MALGSRPLWPVVTALCWLGQGAALFVAGRGGAMSGGSWMGLAWPLALAAVIATWAWRRAATSARRKALFALAAAEASLFIGSLLIGVPWQRQVPTSVERGAVVTAAQQWRGTVDQLGAAMAALHETAIRRLDADGRADLFPLAADLADRWRRDAPAGGVFPLAVAFWRGDSRVAWAEGARPLPLPVPWPTSADPPAEWGRIERGRDAWYWRRFYRLAAGGSAAMLEFQMRLAPVNASIGSAVTQSTGGSGVPPELELVPRVEVTPDPGDGEAPTTDVVAGEMSQGLSLALPDPFTDGARAWLRLTVTRPTASQTLPRRVARLMLLGSLSWTVASAAWGAAVAGPVGLVAGVWLGRALLVAGDLARVVQLAFPIPNPPPRPTAALSLFDPAYFATRAMGGLLASTADALLSALAVVLTAWLIARALSRHAAAQSRRVRWPLGVAFGLIAALVLLGVRELAFTIVANANARLIGTRIALRFLSFWGLHLTLLLVAGGFIGVLALLAARWRCAVAWRGSVLFVLFGAAAASLAIPGLGAPARWGVPALACLVWLTARRTTSPASGAARVALAAPLLATVVWNYLALAEAYGRSEVAWLERRGDEIVLPQEDLVQFLLEDALIEMRAMPVSALKSSEPRLGEIGGLWRDWPAYDLWRRSAVRDLGLPCLVELLDAAGESESLFASGFFRDFRYEVGSRSAWSNAQAVAPGAGGDTYAVQTERRRYPTGDEWVLRGEIERGDEPGWIRLELPVQSRRLGTLLARLAGTSAAPAAGSYAPRAEVDRPILLLRGDDAGWLDAGPTEFPPAGADEVVASLKTAHANWGVVPVGDARYRCLWKRVPQPDPDHPGEGFLLGLEIPSLADRLLDLSRLALLDLLLLGALGLGPLVWGVARRRPRPALGFQERFLLGNLLLGLLPLLLVGSFVDRLTLRGLVDAARDQTRGGLEAAVAQLQGLLGEQARALAGSEYIADLLASRLAGQRPLGPFSVRQGMVFAADGRLLLDETLSDLDVEEAAALLATTRSAPLIAIEDDGDFYLALAVPVDLGDVLAPTDVAGGDDRRLLGTFFYRQRVDADLLAGLAEIIQGEVSLRVGGETVLSSHPERVFSGVAPLLTPPAVAQALMLHPGSPHLAPVPGTRLAFTGTLALPSLAMGGPESGLRRSALPADISVVFPAREREFARQREETFLFLAGLATLIFLAIALLSLALTWQIFGPVRVLVTATRRLAGGDFAAPLPEESRHEVGTLSAAFRSMRDRLAVTQQALAERERFLTTVLDRVPVGVAIFDAQQRVVALNPAALTLLGLTGDAQDAAREHQARRLLRELRGLLGPVAQGERELAPWAGRRTLRARLAPLLLPDGREHEMVVFEDITEFLDNKRLAMNAELARQVAHEIKNPLTPIQLSVQFLDKAYRDRAADLDRIVADTVRQVLDQVALLRAIATEFSLLGRPGELACVPVELPHLVGEIAARYRADRPSEGPRLEIAAEPVPRVLGHPESLMKVLGNLMENSLQARGDARGLVVEVGWQVTEHEVTLLWRDNGPGLPPDVADRLFDLYFSTKSQGTGLGLAICRSLLEKMGGRIALRNRPEGNGAIAEVTLQRAPAPSLGASETRDS